MGKLLELRLKNGLTQQEVADRAQITRSYYGMMETGVRGMKMPASLALRLAEVFNCDIRDIVED